MAKTRSAQILDFPESQLSDHEYVGRKFAGKIETTRAVVYADWVTRIGLALAQRFPSLVKRSTERFIKAHQS